MDSIDRPAASCSFSQPLSTIRTLVRVAHGKGFDELGCAGPCVVLG
jgi:hypothetical protein